jgi:hypothetical protein
MPLYELPSLGDEGSLRGMDLLTSCISAYM